MTQLILATQNAHKVREIKEIAGTHYRIVSLADIGADVTWSETGVTLEENALIKLRATRARARDRSAAFLADDSGLFVPALGGEPGVFSSRYAGSNATDRENTDLLLEKMASLPKNRRNAFFQCVLAFDDGSGEEHIFSGRCEGVIVENKRGAGGFGYDPVFQPTVDGSDSQTLAEMSAAKKNGISHRRKALNLWLAFLQPNLE